MSGIASLQSQQTKEIGRIERMRFPASRPLGGLLFLAAATALLVLPATVHSEDKKEVDGKWTLPTGDPTYNVSPDGTVDWYTMSGFRRYHSICHTCHGPDGLGSSYAPNLTDSLKNLTFEQFQQTVINGKRDVNSASELVMPAFGTDKNVYCYLEDIYVYLKGRSDGAVARGRPAKNEKEPEAAKKYETECMGF
jgi:methanol metabolism-related c-type cytochrome